MPPVSNNNCRCEFWHSSIMSHRYALLSVLFRNVLLDKSGIVGVFRFTHLNALSREEDQNFASRPQTPVLAPVRHSPSPSQTRDRLSLCSARLLRSPRYTPGQIRNAPPSSDRWASDQPHRDCLRMLSAYLLPSPSRLQSRRPGWLATAETRTSSGPQALQRGPRLCRPVASRRWPSLDHAHTPGAYPPKIRLDHPPTQSRTSFDPAQKKTPVISPPCHHS